MLNFEVFSKQLLIASMKMKKSKQNINDEPPLVNDPEWDDEQKFNDISQKKRSQLEDKRSEFENVYSPLYSSKRKYNNEERHAFRKGAFLIAKQDIVKFPECPVWRVDGPCLLQKYEPITLSEDQQKAFRKTLIFSGWANTTRKNYRPVQIQVLIQVCRDVELISVTDIFDHYHSRPSNMIKTENSEIISTNQCYITPLATKVEQKPIIEYNSPSVHGIKSSKFLEIAEKYPIIAETGDIYLQFMLSAAIHPGFLEMVLKDGDEYFTKPYTKMEDFNKSYLESLVLCVEKLDINQNLIEQCKHFPYFDVATPAEETNLQCQGCYKEHQPQLLITLPIKKFTLSGFAYEYATLKELSNEIKNNCNASTANTNVATVNEPLTETEKQNAESLQNLIITPSLEIILCQRCATVAGLISKIYHQRHNMFQKCNEQINNLKLQSSEITGTQLLEVCLFNEAWKTAIFQEFADNWDNVFSYLTEFKCVDSSVNLTDPMSPRVSDSTVTLHEALSNNLLVEECCNFNLQLSAETLNLLAASNNLDFNQNLQNTSNPLLSHQLSQQLSNIDITQLPAQITVNGENGEPLNLLLMKDDQGNEVICYYLPTISDAATEINLATSSITESNFVSLNVYDEGATNSS